MSHASTADRLLIKPTAGARPASPCTLGRFIPKARKRGLTPDESQAARTTTSLATAPDGPTRRLSQTPEATAAVRQGAMRGRPTKLLGVAVVWRCYPDLLAGL
jgi:hypothetical protein